VEINIEIKHVNGMSKPKVTIEEGTISYVLPFEVQLPPGQFDRICNLFRQRTPVQLTISSPQAKMDLFTEVFSDTPTASYTETDADNLRLQARDALKTSEIAERTAAESGDAGDREVADAAAKSAAEAITKAAQAISASQTIEVDESMLLTALAEEIRAETLAEGEIQAEANIFEEGATLEEIEAIEVEVLGHVIDESPSDPEALRRQIDEHASEEEKATAGTKPAKSRKSKQGA